MKFWTLDEPDIDRIALGAGILGTGGGGNPYLGSLVAKALLREGRRICLVRPSDLAADAQVLALSGIGAPTVGVERMAEGDEGLRVVRAMEDYTGRRIDALIADEVGGSNAMTPMIAAAKLDIPVVDADGMGRAFPEVQMTTFFVHGHVSHPAVLADFEGNVMVVTAATSPQMLERLLRAGTVAMGCTAYFGTAPMSGAFVARYAVPHSLSQAWSLGQTVLAARAGKADPVAAIVAASGGALLLRGKVSDVQRSVTGGFVRGRLTVDGLDEDAGRTLRIDIQNENLVARDAGGVLVMVPDLICIVDAETGRPIGTEEQRYGLRVAVVALPAHALLRSEAALGSVGPRAFGYDFDYAPVGFSSEALPAPGYGA